MTYRDPLYFGLTDQDSDTETTDSFGLETEESSEVEYHFDGFTVELNQKVALTPVNLNRQV